MAYSRMAFGWVLLAAGMVSAPGCGGEFGSGEDEQNEGDAASGGDEQASSGGSSAGRAGGKSLGGGSASGGRRATGGRASTGGASNGNAGGAAESDGGMVVPGAGGVSSVDAGSGAGGDASGGARGSGGAPGTGGSNSGCGAPQLECDHDPPRRCGDDGKWLEVPCGPLKLTDLAGIETGNLPGFDVGFRCKSLSVCTVEETCLYFLENFGSVQSSESSYTDGHELQVPAAVKVRLTVGAASQCLDPAVKIEAGETFALVLPSGGRVDVHFPALQATESTFYVREDGATFADAALTQHLAGP